MTSVSPAPVAPQRVSVIITCFNYGEFLCKCVESVLSQTYSNWEAVIVDDESTDATPEVGSALAGKYPDRIRYIRQKNSGVATARNTGIDNSTGEFILPLDADDVLLPNALEEFVRKINENEQYAFAYCCLELLDGLPGEGSEWLPGSFSREKLLHENIAPNTALWRRALWLDGVRYRDGLIYEDWDIFLQMLQRGFEGGYIPIPLFQYRVHVRGRYSVAQKFFFQGVAQLMRANADLYEHPFHKSFAEKVLFNAPGSMKLPTVVFLAEPGVPGSSPLKGPFAELPGRFIESGHLVIGFGEAEREEADVPGVHYISYAGAYLPNGVRSVIEKFGSNIIVLSECPAKFSFIAKMMPMVRLVINLRDEHDPDAHFQLRRVGDLYHLNGEDTLLGTLLTSDALAHKLSALSRQIDDKRNEEYLRRRQTLHALRCERRWEREDTPRNENQRITVIIPTRNVSPERLSRCLCSIRESETAYDVPIIISDYGSHGEVLSAINEIAKENDVRVITSKTRAPWSRGRAANIGIRAAETPWIVCTDADMIYHPKTFAMWRVYQAALGDSFSYNTQCIKLPPIPSSEFPSPWNSEHFGALAGRGRLFGTFGHGAFQAFTRECLLRIRGFDEAYKVWGSEDNDLSYRASLGGVDLLWMCPGMLLHQWHLKAVSSSHMAENRQRFEASLNNPTIIVNDENWGTITKEEEEEYRKFGPLEPIAREDALSPAQEVSRAILRDGIRREEQIDILLKWGTHALLNHLEESALESFEDVLTLDPQNLLANIRLAETHLALGSLDRASHLASYVLRLNPGNERGLKILEVIREVREKPIL